MAGLTREDVKPAVVHVIAVISGFADDFVAAGEDAKKPKSLESDLGMSSDLRGAMAPGFKRIARGGNPSASISKTECKKLKTVTDCIDLVFKRATQS